eukprot:TRINITY_DN31431_c0_g1_i1.p1 TRINITY_DN31431_c0_g1~~TRINITY_DN31431_c0_g1_i1.p1  ORF type:complete len:1853 (-),score=121.15 TRINITY_DN31431_c0_g1_i1:222-5324(-)
MEVDLIGCFSLRPCKPPVLDKCQYDVSDCFDLEPNATCSITCKSPYVGTTTGLGICPLGNTDSRTRVSVLDLPVCTRTCPDPPAGHPYWLRYQPVPERQKWVCNPGYSGDVSERCLIDNMCVTRLVLTGCLPEEPCAKAEVRAGDCKVDTSACLDVRPGRFCEVSCEAPCYGPTTKATCPAGNTKRGRSLELEDVSRCTFDCDSLPVGYMKTEHGWECAPGYTGSPVDGCAEGLVCEAELTLSGCELIVGCGPPIADSCMYNTSDCEMVLPGETCEVRCMWPYAGVTTQASCSANNTLLMAPADWSAGKKNARCYVFVCPDPEVAPTGYVRSDVTETGWECAPGYTTGNRGGTLTRTCGMLPGCQPMAFLSGCRRAVSCVGVRSQDNNIFWGGNVDFCMYNISMCNDRVDQGVPCEIPCRSPYVGLSTFATCADGNLDPYARVSWTPGNCTISCPMPEIVPEGYIWQDNCTDERETSLASSRNHPDVHTINMSSIRQLAAVNGCTDWQCSANFFGSAEFDCTVDDDCNSVFSFVGCHLSWPCVAPEVDPCQFDVSACRSVEPGGTCEIRCISPYSGSSSIGVCPEGNILPNQPVKWSESEPYCTLDEICENTWPVPVFGYIDDPWGNWFCVDNHAGNPYKYCVTRPDCTEKALVTGCLPITSCAAPDLRTLDACMYDLSACLDVPAGGSCLIKCAPTYVGEPAIATCVEENTDPHRKLTYTLPSCRLECPDPEIIPPGYQRSVDADIGWSCTAGHSGKASRLCTFETTYRDLEPDRTGGLTGLSTCHVTASLIGCEPLQPCALPASSDDGGTACELDISECLSVWPGLSCIVRCRPPYFAGDDVVARCPLGNTDPDRALVWESVPPSCTLSCPNPDPVPFGYDINTKGLAEQWRCEEGHIGDAIATCVFSSSCTAELALSGCSLLVPCVMPEVSDPCVVNMSSCGESVLPGASCEVTCQYPYVGTTSNFSCDTDNIDPLQVAEGTLPVCVLTCPDPASPPVGYTLRVPDTNSSFSLPYWECEQGYTGIAVRECDIDETCKERTILSNCGFKVPCAPLKTDDCKFDTSDCSDVVAGGSCMIHCRFPAKGNSTVASCHPDNINPAKNLTFEWPSCRVEPEDCIDVVPAGYAMSITGWVCGQGYAGTVVESCTANVVCDPELRLSGCAPLQSCGADLASMVDRCRYDVSECLDVFAGGLCELRCKAPYVGSPVAASCPSNTTDPRSAVIFSSLPECELQGCPDPSVSPIGFLKTAQGRWACARGYSGDPVKVCRVDARDCSLKDGELIGCEGRMPCVAPTTFDPCIVDTSNCSNVLFGASCELRCRAPFVGTPSVARCPATNTDPLAVVQYTEPNCALRCPDPDPESVGAGYVLRSTGEWHCADGWVGIAVKHCPVSRPSCETSTTLEGCARKMPCVAPPSRNDLCHLDISCSTLPAGGSCEVRCKPPFYGGISAASCPSTNTNQLREFVLPSLDCSCGDPDPLPLGYEVYKDSWVCSAGYVGKANLVCRTSDGCLAMPRISGCELATSCGVEPFLDVDDRKGIIGGIAAFGPAARGEAITEANVVDYGIFLTDICGKKLGSLIAKVPKRNPGEGGWEACCPSDFYSTKLENVAIPDDATQLLVVVRTRFGFGNEGLSIPFQDRHSADTSGNTSMRTNTSGRISAGSATLSFGRTLAWRCVRLATYTALPACVTLLLAGPLSP